VDKTLTFQKLTDITRIIGSEAGRASAFRVIAALFAGTPLGAALPIEKAQNGNERPLPRVGMDLGLAPLPLGVGTTTARPRGRNG